MTARRTSSPSLAFPLILIAFAIAVSQNWLGAPELLATGVDAWFGLWAWLGEQVVGSITDAATPSA